MSPFRQNFNSYSQVKEYRYSKITKTNVLISSKIDFFIQTVNVSFKKKLFYLDKIV